MNPHSIVDPRPGSPEAVAQGCICPPQIGPEPIYDQNCPVHAATDHVEVSLDSPLDPDRLEP